MRQIYDRILDIRGNLITVSAEKKSLGELALIHKADGRKILASVLRFDNDLVTLQVLTISLGTTLLVGLNEGAFISISSCRILGPPSIGSPWPFSLLPNKEVPKGLFIA